MDIKYNITKLKGSNRQEVQYSISVEEPLEMSLKFKIKDKWNAENISITMRTPGNDEDLISGFLYNERIIENINEIEKVEKKGEIVGDYNLQNKIVATINNTKNLDIGKIKRNFVTNSSCGVCGKTSLDSIEVLKNNKVDLSFSKINYDIISKSPEFLRSNQSEFSRTGGIHASALIDNKGKVIAIREDVGRHNALDKLIGHGLKNKIIEPLHSRCSVVDFAIHKRDKPTIAAQFFSRLTQILEGEKIDADKKVVAELINKQFPDWRRVLN